MKKQSRPPLHDFSGCNYADDGSFPDPCPSPRRPAFCFGALTAGGPARENAEVHNYLKDSLTLCAAPSPLFTCVVLCVCVDAAMSLFLYCSPASFSFSICLSFLFSPSPPRFFPSGVLRRLLHTPKNVWSRFDASSRRFGEQLEGSGCDGRFVFLLRKQ